MKIRIQNLIILLTYIANSRSECDVCQSSSFVACHRENKFSLCINGVPTRDIITCPENHVCTPDPLVCYPLPLAQPTCVRKTNLCGVCSDKKVYACTNETTIAFCYGQDKPIEGEEVSYCLGDTVCDIYSEKGFCTENYLVRPSCVTTPDAETTTTISTKTSSTTADLTTITHATTVASTEDITTKATIVNPTSEMTTTTTAAESTTNIEPITAITTTTKLTNITTTTEPTSTHTTTKPTQLPLIKNALIDAKQFCKGAARSGSFYAGDPTCTTFVICYKINDGPLYGYKKSCPNGEYFPPGAKICSSQKSDACV